MPRAFIVAAIFIAAFGGAYFLRSATPDTVSPRAEASASRIVSLKPSVTEFIFALGQGHRVVAVTDYCAYPPEVEALPSIGGLYNTNIELIRELDPDRVIMAQSHEGLQPKLEALGIPCVLINKQETLTQIFDSIPVIAEACGATEAGVQLEESMREAYAVARANASTLTPRRTLITVSRDLSSPRVEEVYAVGPGAFLDEILLLAGGINVVPQGVAQFPTLSAEGIIRLDPEVIIEIAPGAEEAGVDVSTAREAWQSFDQVNAVANGKVFVLTEDYLAVPGPRVLRIVEQFRELLHPGSDENDT